MTSKIVMIFTLGMILGALSVVAYPDFAIPLLMFVGIGFLVSSLMLATNYQSPLQITNKH